MSMNKSLNTLYQSCKNNLDTYQKQMAELETSDIEAARKKAKESLIEAGILNEDGTPKTNICTN